MTRNVMTSRHANIIKTYEPNKRVRIGGRAVLRVRVHARIHDMACATTTIYRHFSVVTAVQLVPL